MRIVAIASLIWVPVAAFGGKAEADSCASSLKGSSKTLYEAAAQMVADGEDLEAAVRKTARDMVAAGTLSRSNAKKHALPAAQCLSKFSS